MKTYLFPLAFGCLMLTGSGCGRGVAPQKSEPLVTTKHTRDTIYLTSQDFVAGDDCSQAVTAMHKTNQLLDKCEKDVNLLLADNVDLKEKLEQSGKKVKIKNSYNTDNSQVINLRKSNQMLAQDNARLKADSAVMADKLKEKPKVIIKKVGNTKEGKDRFWLGVLVAVGAFQALRLAKRYVVLLPPPFGPILSKILNLIA